MCAWTDIDPVSLGRLGFSCVLASTGCFCCVFDMITYLAYFIHPARTLRLEYQYLVVQPRCWQLLPLVDTKSRPGEPK